MDELRVPHVENAARFYGSMNCRKRDEIPAETWSPRLGQSYSQAEPVADVDSKAKNIPPIGYYSANETTFSNVAVCGCILSQNVHLLVDTGAAISVVREQFYNATLQPSVQLKKNNLISNIKTADGNTFPDIGFASFEINHSCSCDAPLSLTLLTKWCLDATSSMPTTRLLTLRAFRNPQFQGVHRKLVLKSCCSIQATWTNLAL